MQGKRRHQPAIQRPLILDVLPPDIAPRLDVLPGSFYKRLVRKIPLRLRHWWVAAGAAAVVAAVLVVVWQPGQTPSPQLPAAIRSQISDFVPYYFSGAIPGGVTVQHASISYSDGVLFFQVNDQNGHEVVVSEQALPAAFANQQLQGNRKISGVDGSATVSDSDGRLIGNFITSRNPRALISLNASDTVSAATAQTILQSLKPIAS